MNIKKTATIIGPYRYELSRFWDESKSCLRFLMLNPSTADAFLDDPTIRRCIGFAKFHDYGGIVVLNLYAIRSSKPRKPNEWSILDVGPKNDETIKALTAGCDILCAWGTNAAQKRVNEVFEIINGRANLIMCLGETTNGNPRHPLYVKSNHPFLAWAPQKLKIA